MTSIVDKPVVKEPTPEEYRRFIKGIDLRQIQLVEMTAKFNAGEFNDSLKINISSDSEYSSNEDGFSVTHTYELVGKNSSRKIAIKITATYLIYFTNPREMMPEYFAIYHKVSLPMNIWPFFRELVHSTTARMNIPSLTIPLMKR